MCDGIVRHFGEKICPECKNKLIVVKKPFCRKCGKPMESTESAYCYDCLNKRQEYTRGFGLYHYNSAATSIYRFKYKGRREYAAFFAEEIVKNLGEEIRQMKANALLPVPIHKSRFRDRGYNQASVLAKEIEKILKIPVYDDLIIREKKTIPLKKLNPLERQNNLKKAFKIARNDVKLDTIIIIDDIYTTGSTINEISRELKQLGVKNIFFITLAIGAGM